MNNEDANYFEKRSKEEDSPFHIEPEVSIRYAQLENVFNSFFPKDYLSVAKDQSKHERDSKNINDTSFTYGEIVSSHSYNIINIDIQIDGIYI